jgi:hypothetical protein
VTVGTDDAGRRDGDPADPPSDDDGEWICGRACRDGTPCRRSVALPGMACHEHEGQSPLVEATVEESE